MPQPRNSLPNSEVIRAATKVAAEIEPIIWAAAERLGKRFGHDERVVGAVLADVLADQVLRQQLAHKWAVEAEAGQQRGAATQLRLAGAELLGCSRSTYQRRMFLVGGS